MNANNERSKVTAAMLGICFVLALAVIGVGRSEAKQKKVLKQAVDAQGAPMFRVDPFWPKPLAQSLEHAAGDGPLCGTKEQPRLVLESRRERRRR